MEMEKRLEKWDALFEELKEVVEQLLPAVEKSVKEISSRVSDLEQRMSVLEKELADFRTQSSEKSQNVDEIKNSFLSVVEDLGNSLNAEISNLRNEMQGQIEDLRKSIGSRATTEVDTAKLKEFEKEIGEVRELVTGLSREIEHLRNQMVEKHRILREKKVEGKSPRIL